MPRPIVSASSPLLLAIALVGLLACGANEDSPVAVVTPDPPSQTDTLGEPEQLTVENAILVRDALKLWSEGAWHHYPSSLMQRNLLGQTLIDLLPDGQLLVNSFTGQGTEPRMESAETPGAIHYSTSQYSQGQAIDYTVEAYGLAAPIWSDSSEEFSAWKDLERRTYVNAVIVQIAVEDWTRERGGAYPGTLSQVNTAGHSVIDFLPEGRLLANPFTITATEPVDGFAATPGQVGFVTISQGGTNTGYTITAWGRTNALISLRERPGMLEQTTLALIPEVLDPEIVTLRNAVAVRRAVRRWSQENGGSYPADLAATNSLGHTLMDLLLGGLPLRNPFTGAHSEPRIGQANSAGQVSYSRITEAGGNSSFRIEAFGENMPLWSWEPRGN